MIDLNGNSVAVEKTVSRRFDKEEQETQLAFAEGFVKAVTEAMSDIYNHAYFIGFRLDEANRYKYYETLGYASIADLAEAEFGFKRSTTYGLMQAFNYAKSETPLYIADEFKGYSYTALLEMSKAKSIKWLNTSHGIERILTPKVSVSKIKEVRPLWDKYITEHGTLPPCKSLDEFLELVKEQEPPAPSPLLELAAETEPTLPQTSEENPVQSTGLAEAADDDEAFETELEEPAEELEELAASNCYNGEDYSQYDDECTRVENVSDDEIIKVALKAGTNYSNSKFKIYEKFQEQPLKSEFLSFVQKEYGLGHFSIKDYGSSGCTNLQGMYITKPSGKEIFLPWQYVAGRISRLIETNEYLSVEEHARFVEWKAEQDGLIVNVAKSLKPKHDEPKMTNWEFLKTRCTCQMDLVRVVAQGVKSIPNDFGVGMPDRINQWLFIWLNQPLNEI